MIAPEDVLQTALSLGRALAGIDRSRAPRAYESLLRAATSRFYYAAFATARETAERWGYVEVSGFGSHEALWNWFDEEGFSHVRRAGGRLKRFRVLADYRLDAEVTWFSSEIERRVRFLLQDLKEAEETLRRRLPTEG